MKQRGLLVIGAFVLAAAATAAVFAYVHSVKQNAKARMRVTNGYSRPLPSSGLKGPGRPAAAPVSSACVVSRALRSRRR